VVCVSAKRETIMPYTARWNQSAALSIALSLVSI